MRDLPKLDYRPEIDGLRAVAILPVLFFHVGFAGFAGGFVGVDVFFVISGYLITRLIVTEIEDQRFSFVRFYERRARRLFPALFVTVLIALILGQFLLPVQNRIEAAGSAVFSVAWLSNVYFWSVSGYFETDSITKPLLHTWSLSIEEQFYLFWPAALFLVSKRIGRTTLPWIIGIAGVASLLACVWFLPRDRSLVFYLTPFRIVEFSIGAVVVWVERRFTARAALQEAILTAGLGMIFVAVFAFDANTVFPGPSALLPCIGTALAIYAGRSTFAGRLLSNPVSVRIGMISYSLYLIHWPIVVFFDAQTLRSPSLVERIGIVVASIGLALLMYKFIETPFRRPPVRRRWSARAYGLACAAFSIGLIVPAAWLWANPAAHSSEETTRSADPGAGTGDQAIPESKLAALKEDRHQRIPGKTCPLDGGLCGAVVDGMANVLILGDSHAEDAYNAMSHAFPKVNFLLARAQTCVPFEEPTRPHAAKCAPVVAMHKKQIATLTGVDAIVVQVRMIKGRAGRLVQYAQHLIQEGHRVVVVGGGVEYTRSLPEVYQKLANAEDPFPDLGEFRTAEFFDDDELVREAVQSAGGVFIDRRSFLCPEGRCSDYTRARDQLVLADRNHMSWEAALEFGRYIRLEYPDLFRGREVEESAAEQLRSEAPGPFGEATTLEELMEASILGYRPLTPYGGFVLNSKGLRTREYSAARNSGTIRVLTLGDSFTFASGGVPYPDLWTSRLEVALSGRTESPVEVLNLGVPGAGPHFARRMWQIEGSQLDADLVVLGFFVGDDFWDAVRDPDRPKEKLDLKRIEPVARGGYAVSSYVYDPPQPSEEQLVRSLANHAQICSKSQTGVFEDQLAAVRKVLESLNAEIEQSGSWMIVLIIPDEFQVDARLFRKILESRGATESDYELDRPQRRLIEALEGAGIQYVDLLPVLRGRDEPVFSRNHLNLLGNRLAAETLAARIPVK